MKIPFFLFYILYIRIVYCEGKGKRNSIIKSVFICKWSYSLVDAKPVLNIINSHLFI